MIRPRSNAKIQQLLCGRVYLQHDPRQRGPNGRRCHFQWQAVSRLGTRAQSHHVTGWAGPEFVRWAVREERGQIYCAPEVLEITNRYDVSSSVLVAQSLFTSPRLFTSMPRSTRRRHHMHQHLPPRSSSPIAPVDLQAFPPIESVLSRLPSSRTTIVDAGPRPSRRVARARSHHAPRSPPPRPRLSRRVARASRHRVRWSPLPPRPRLSLQAARRFRAHLSPPPWPRLGHRVARARRPRATLSPPPWPRLSRRVAVRRSNNKLLLTTTTVREQHPRSHHKGAASI